MSKRKKATARKPAKKKSLGKKIGGRVRPAISARKKKLLAAAKEF